MAMKKSIKKKWVAALRSNKYKQGKQKLRTQNNEFCCLGVLCELARQEGVIPQARRYTNGYGTNWVYGKGPLDERWAGTLPPEVVQWAGLDSSNPQLDRHSAAEWNDSQGANFNKIADLIEEHL